MSKQWVPLLIVLLAASSLTAPTFGQNVPPVSNPVCVPVPGIPCSGSGTSSTGASGAANMKAAIQGEIAATVVQSFLQMLFSNDSKANAQKQKMLAELALRQAEAEKQHKIEEAKRLAAICARLQAMLKLSGLPQLHLKADENTGANGELHLKLGDSSDNHAGVPGLPGIALNDNSGNGSNRPYGIQGLPGIYVNGPSTPPTSPTGGSASSSAKLQLKLGDSGSSSTSVAGSPAPMPGSQAPSTGSVPDPRDMSPKQLADLATQVNNLPPEEQQRLMEAAHASAQGGASAVSGLPSAQPAAAASDQPAMTQLQQVANSSQAAAKAPGLESAAAGARQGFDTAAGSAPTAGAVPVGMAAPTTAVVHHPAASSAPSLPAAHPSSALPVATLQSPTNNPSPPGKSAPSLASTTRADNANAASAPCPPGVAKVIPSRQQLLTELAVRRAQLESLKNTILRLNRTVQLDQQQFAVWQDEAQAGLDRVKGRIFDLWTQGMFDNFVESKEEDFEALEKEGKLTAFDKEQWRRLELAKDLKSFDDFRKWVMEDKGNWEMIEEGARQLIDHMPLQAEAMSYVRCGEDLIDNLYDFTDLAVTWNNVQQLDHNSTQFLTAVRQNGERMKAIVERIQQIQMQLNSTPEGPPTASPCREVRAKES
jgi:hypothetical protein